MNHSKSIVSLVLVGLFFFAASANAATDGAAKANARSVEESGIANEVNSCIAAVREHLDYTDIARVRHDVLAIERRTVGYTLKIRTFMYDVTDERVNRAYEATCVVNGKNVPMSFEIREGL